MPDVGGMLGLEVPWRVREELDRITKDGVAKDQLGSLVHAVLDVARHHGLRIELVEVPDPSKEFNCFRYALKLRELPEWVYDACMCANPPTGVKSDFVRSLLEDPLVLKESNDIHDGDIAIYFDNGTITHAGLVQNGRVVSKWGSGHIWIHGVMEVPSAYGSHVRFYAPIDSLAALRRFEAYLRTQYGDDFVDDFNGSDPDDLHSG
jgi:hypothetical protein